jgi:hypothetical protein
VAGKGADLGLGIGDRHGMEPVTRFGLIPRRPGMTVEEFQAHWRTEHAEVAVGMPGITRYWQNHRILPPIGPRLPWPGFDACSEIDAESVGAHLAMRASPAYLGPISADEPRLLDVAKASSVWTRRCLSSGTTDDGVRLLRFMRASPVREVTELAELLTAPSRAAEAGGREVFLALRGRDAMQLCSSFDAVEALWFTAPDAACAYLDSGPADRDRAELAGIVSGVELVLVHINRVV